jgi:nucleoid-associated protein YgaU
MSLRRLVLSAAGTVAIAALLSALTPALPVMTAALTQAQRTVDTGGADALVLAAAGLLAWAVWLWGAVGLGLTALAAAPGLLGATSSVLVRLVLPAAARRSAAGLLGLGLSVAPLLGTVSVLQAPTAAAAVTVTATATPTSSPAVPDWPSSAAQPAVPDWPAVPPTTAAPTPSSGMHVVVRGDCLWDIAASRLAQGRPSAPTDGEIARAVRAWWSVNARLIGPDPDLLLPGQALSPPPRP